MLISDDKMWSRFKALKKQRSCDDDPEIHCDICGKVIHLHDKGVAYSKTKTWERFIFP